MVKKELRRGKLEQVGGSQKEEHSLHQASRLLNAQNDSHDVICGVREGFVYLRVFSLKLFLATLWGTRHYDVRVWGGGNNKDPGMASAAQPRDWMLSLLCFCSLGCQEY